MGAEIRKEGRHAVERTWTTPWREVDIVSLAFGGRSILEEKMSQLEFAFNAALVIHFALYKWLASQLSAGGELIDFMHQCRRMPSVRLSFVSTHCLCPTSHVHGLHPQRATKAVNIWLRTTWILARNASSMPNSYLSADARDGADRRVVHWRAHHTKG